MFPFFKEKHKKTKPKPKKKYTVSERGMMMLPGKRTGHRYIQFLTCLLQQVG